jgi:transposase, IS5 family
MAGKLTEFRVAMRPGKRRALPETAEGTLQDLIETTKAHIRSKVEHPFSDQAAVSDENQVDGPST